MDGSASTKAVPKLGYRDAKPLRGGSDTTPASGFSLVELIIVIVIIGIVALIAVPRAGAAASNAIASSLLSNTILLQNAMDTYAAEHSGRQAYHAADASLDISGPNFIARLTSRTKANGVVFASGQFGPYLSKFPANAAVGRADVTITDRQPGLLTGGWLVVPRMGVIIPDDPRSAAFIAAKFDFPWVAPSAVIGPASALPALEAPEN